MKEKASPYSNLKIFAHPDKLEAIKKEERTAPVYVRIKPTNACNHRCYYCSYADNDLGLRDEVKVRDRIPWPKMQEIINDLGDMGVKAVTFSGGGEPLVYPEIAVAMRAVLDKGIDLSIITNGHRLHGQIAEILSSAKWVRISLDAANAERYAKIRGISLSSFQEVCDNIKNFAKIKSLTCELGINFVINHENAFQVYDTAKLVRDLGVNHIKYTARITKDLDNYHRPFKEEALEQLHKAENDLSCPDFKIINKYEDDFLYSTVFKRNYKDCRIKEFITVIAADCRVYFCHDKAYVSDGVVGDLHNTSFKELWFSPEVIQRYRDFDASKECCHHCVFDDRNILLNNFLSLDENHINFI
ncbi:MAG: radical SAM protein [Bacillota bacterium]|nr:radical SAM protein [Bacillota bacterium]